MTNLHDYYANSKKGTVEKRSECRLVLAKVEAKIGEAGTVAAVYIQ